MNSRERLMATLDGKPVDRPAVNFYEIGGFSIDPDDPDPFNIYNAPSWRPLLDLAEEQTDLIRMGRLRSRPAAACRSQEFERRETYFENGSRFTKTTIEAGGRTLTQLARRDPDADTLWMSKHLLKDVEDLKAYLKLPDAFFEKDEVDIEALQRLDERVGTRGIVMADTEDPICEAAGLFDMATYTILAVTESALMHHLLERIAGPIQRRTEAVARAFPGHLWRIYGPEYAVEPYLPPHCFEEYVVRYTQPMVESIQRHGGYARIHSHGRVARALPQIVAMGASATDPLEPPPQGNVDLGEVRRRYGRDLVLFGNIEISDIENLPPPRFREMALRAVADGTHGEGRGFVLMPTSCPYGRTITSNTMTNYETLAEVVKQC